MPKISRPIQRKFTVFVAHSFSKASPEGNVPGDIEIAQHFIRMLRHSPFGYRVISGERPEPRDIDQKIMQRIESADCFLGLFTRKHHIPEENKWLPPLWIVSEAGYAFGQYQGSTKIVCGFHEEGVDPQDLALVTTGGMEIPSFNRDNLDSDKDKHIAYLKELPTRVFTTRAGQLVLTPLHYSQALLHKIYTVYRDGYVVVQNMNNMIIHDAEQFLREHEGKITHEIWNETTNFPPLEEMLANKISDRRQKPFLFGILDRRGAREMGTPLQITPVSHQGKRATFSVGFKDHDGRPLSFKNNDNLKYQYVWGLPNCYPVFEEDLDPLIAERINGVAYNKAGMISNHGRIRRLVLELRFERESRVDRMVSVFDKEPFMQTTASFGSSPRWANTQTMPRVREDEHEIFFETYMVEHFDFEGQLRALWRPCSTSQ